MRSEKLKTTEERAENRVGRWILYTAVVILLVIADQWTKYLAVSHLKGREPFVLIRGVLEFRYLENSGAAFSMLQNRHVFFYVLTGLFLVIAVYILKRIPGDVRYRPVRICTLVLIAGAAGNLIDRIAHKYVVDFIYFSIIDFPVFNMADIYVTISVTVLVILVLFYYKEEDFRFLKKQAAKKRREESR